MKTSVMECNQPSQLNSMPTNQIGLMLFHVCNTLRTHVYINFIFSFKAPTLGLDISTAQSISRGRLYHAVGVVQVAQDLVRLLLYIVKMHLGNLTSQFPIKSKSLGSVLFFQVYSSAWLVSLTVDGGDLF